MRMKRRKLMMLGRFNPLLMPFAMLLLPGQIPSEANLRRLRAPQRTKHEATRYRHNDVTRRKEDEFLFRLEDERFLSHDHDLSYDPKPPTPVPKPVTLRARMGRYQGSNFVGNPQGDVTFLFQPNGDIGIAMNVFGVAPFCSGTNTQPNGCGVHIQEGMTCNQAGGDFWDRSKFNNNPWTNIRYSSDSTGTSTSRITMAFGNGYDARTNSGRAVVIYDQAGARIACGTLAQELPVPTPSPIPPPTQGVILQAQMGRYPGSSFAGIPGGDVTMTFQQNGDLGISMDVQGVARSCSSSNTQVNGCGVHIHEGTNCNDASTVGGHFWNQAVSPVDPWINIRYDSNAAGVSMEQIIMPGGNGYDANINRGRTVVIHDATGARIACGILNPPSTGPVTLRSRMGRYPDSTYTGFPQGEVMMTFHSTGDIDIFLDVDGVTPNCSETNTQPNGCGVHIHEGTNCVDASTVGGHFWDMSRFPVDPWINIRYRSNANGESTRFILMPDGNGYDSTTNNGHTVVIHDQNGGRIACGVLGPMP